MAKQNTQLAVLTEEQETGLVSAIERCHLAQSMENNAIKSLRLASGVQQLRSVLVQKEIQDMIMSFQGSALGFRTDKDRNGGYPANIVIDCAIEALGKGANMHGNEFNIIASRAYFTKEFFGRLLREHCQKNKIKRGVNYDCKYLEKSGNQNKYEVKAEIYYQGINDKEPIKHKKTYKLLGTSEDQVLGKAEKRAHQFLYNELTNNNFSAVPDDADFFDMPNDKKDSSKDKEEKPTGGNQKAKDQLNLNI